MSGCAVPSQGIDQPYHPLGLIYETNDDFDRSVFADGTPAFADVLEATGPGASPWCADYLTTVTPDDLEVPHTNPWAPEYSETTLACLHTILGEEWEHLRYAHRDLDVIEAAPAAG